MAKAAVAALNTYRVTVAHPRDANPPCITDVEALYFEADEHRGWVRFYDAEAVCVFAASDIACRQVELVGRRDVLTIPAESAGLVVHALESYRPEDSDAAEQLSTLLAALRKYQVGHSAPASVEPGSTER